MDETYNRQQRALAKAKQVVLDAEKARSHDKVGSILKEFSAGNREVLGNQEFSDNLGPYLYQLYLEGNRSEVLALLCLFDDCVVEEDLTLRENSVLVISKFASLILDSNDLEILCILFFQLVDWLEFETDYIKPYGVACNQAHKVTQRLLNDEKYWQVVAKLTAVLDRIQTGALEKNNDIQETIAKLQESLATKDNLEYLINCYLKDTTSNKRVAAEILTALGRRSIIYLINQLMHSTDKNTRLQLVKLIPDAGAPVIPLLKDCLQKKPPWYVVRNIVFIFSELNMAELFHKQKHHLTRRR